MKTRCVGPSKHSTKAISLTCPDMPTCASQYVHAQARFLDPSHHVVILHLKRKCAQILAILLDTPTVWR